MTIALLYSLESGNLIPPNPFFFLKIVLASQVGAVIKDLPIIAKDAKDTGLKSSSNRRIKNRDRKWYNQGCRDRDSSIIVDLG